MLGNVTPYERLTGQKPNLTGVPEWGQRVWVHNGSGSKLDRHATEARWVGYDEDSTHAHRVYWPETQRISVERNIQFTADSITVSVPTPRSAPSAQPPATPPIQPAQPSQQHAMQPPPATDSGKEEVEVKDELVDQTPVPAVPPMRTSAPIRQPPYVQPI